MGRKRNELQVEIVKPARIEERHIKIGKDGKRLPLLLDGYVTHRLGVYHG